MHLRQTGEFVSMDKCPVCSAERELAKDKVIICGVNYLQCANCSHVFAATFPTTSTLERHYKENALTDTYYMDPDEIKLRLKEIYVPKIEWIVDVYRRTFDREPKSILDIGAGAGHFLYGCKQKGLDVAGIEYSRDHIRWCEEHFEIELCADKNEVGQRGFDIVCSFNVIEHTYAPGDFVKDYRRFMHERSLAVIETPKANSFNTFLQSIYPDEPRGLLVPYEHNHLFTDSSLAVLLFENGLAPKSVWYFGQDMAELIMRICAEQNVDSSELMTKLYPELQQALDFSHGSNLMLFAAILSEMN
jgi:SAM-dependent methyltransferase